MKGQARVTQLAAGQVGPEPSCTPGVAPAARQGGECSTPGSRLYSPWPPPWWGPWESEPGAGSLGNPLSLPSEAASAEVPRPPSRECGESDGQVRGGRLSLTSLRP